MAKFWQMLGFNRSLSKTSRYNKQAGWQAKRIELADVAEKIPNGSNITIGSTSATAHATLAAIVKDKSLLDINILQFIVGGELPHLEEHPNRFRTTTNFAFDRALQKIRQGITDYVPVSASNVNRLFVERLVPVDIAIIKVTPPNKRGMCSLGMGVDFARESVMAAKVVIAEVSEFMPWTSGDSLIHTDDINWWIAHNVRLLTADELFPKLNKNVLSAPVLAKIAENVISEIPDGATLKFDLNIAVNQLVPFLKVKKDLGLHTDLLTDELLQLIKSGVINNTKKTIQRGKTVVSHASGGKALFRYIHRNPKVEFHSLYKINRIDHIAQQDNLIAIIGGLKIDLSGQVAVDSIGSRFYTGVGSSDDSIRGAGYSKGGKPIVVLPSTSVNGNSNILFALPKGTGVTITRQDVHYVITEYGTAFLFGKSIRERCLALIDIAHPNFRKHLLDQAKNSFYIHSEQSGNSYISAYPKILECAHQTKQDKKVFVRPIRALDEDRLRDFFHKLSDHNVYMRYFSHIRSLPQKVLKQFSDIDYAKDMALVVLYPPQTTQQEIVGIGQWFIDPHDGVPELALQIRDDWQGQGLGYFMFLRLTEIAKSYEIKQLKADVLVDNSAMNRVFETSDIPYQRKIELGVYSYVFDLSLRK
ncbi:MAG: acyl-CoA hydrolase/RimJ/RimL family protein N-acetyltransferase [Alphaproteobacteria bacterium]|jgi:acyl-CoA hydrolase/RimJ/RimL family protein N-acetyltransferase